MSYLKSMVLLSASLALSAPAIAAADGQSDPYECQPRQIQKDERFPFSVDAQDGMWAVMIQGDIRVRLYKGNDDITQRMESRLDGDTGQASLFLELHGARKNDRGRYLIEIEQGGRGSICVAAPG
ncbi:hypothetical protein [Neisseria shayeganii]|uniref:Uncharacterized protein n=1 Tax=Neisseria shayeganii 871 TaxID=1032488 RepID=G4CFS5_9NEIS|nr:hypothetical protein [Neisseria shayeganii]EGY53341.1 hypothetical protein HMPREF9371_0450 [Neisseria shayeganii 871]